MNSGSTNFGRTLKVGVSVFQEGLDFFLSPIFKKGSSFLSVILQYPQASSTVLPGKTEELSRGEWKQWWPSRTWGKCVLPSSLGGPWPWGPIAAEPGLCLMPKCATVKKPAMPLQSGETLLGAHVDNPYCTSLHLFEGWFLEHFPSAWSKSLVRHLISCYTYNLRIWKMHISASRIKHSAR